MSKKHRIRPWWLGYPAGFRHPGLRGPLDFGHWTTVLTGAPKGRSRHYLRIGTGGPEGAFEP
jgi:hypothetical protein